MDEEVLAALIPRLRRYARALKGNAWEADDLVRERLARALGRSRLFSPGTDLRAWLFTMLHNVHVNDVRSARARYEVPWPEEGLAPAAVPPPQEQADLLRDLARALSHLDEDARACLLLVALEGMRYEEVARVLNIPVGTVMSRLSRARERLRAAMGGGGRVLRRVK